MSVAAVIPAFNEAQRIGAVLRALRGLADEVIVADDASSDATGELAAQGGARVFRTSENLGYKGALLHGMRQAGSDIIVTLDADGEHAPKLIELLTGPIVRDEADLVLATRPYPPRWSERAIARLTSTVVATEDASTGFRAMRRDLFERMSFPGPCLCGSFILEAAARGARILQLSLPPEPISKARRRSWVHSYQWLTVARLMPSARQALRDGRSRVLTRRA